MKWTWRIVMYFRPASVYVIGVWKPQDNRSDGISNGLSSLRFSDQNFICVSQFVSFGLER